MPQNAYFSGTHDLLVSQKVMQRHFFSTLHPLSPVIFTTATVVAFVLPRSSRFNTHCCTQCETTPTQKSAQKWRCDLSRLLAQRITKGIHLCKPASLNRPISKKHFHSCTIINNKGWFYLIWRFCADFLKSVKTPAPHPQSPFLLLLLLLLQVDVKSVMSFNCVLYYVNISKLYLR